MRYLPLLIAPLLLAATSPSDAQLHFVLDPVHSDIRASVSFLGIGSKTARFPSASGRILFDPEHVDAMQLDISLDANALTAGDQMTTERLKGPQFFDVAHYPALHFTGQHIEMTGETTARLTGSVTARGVTRPATVNVTFAQPPMSVAAGQPIRLDASMAINRDDFGMTAYHFIVGRNVTIDIQATMVPA